MAKVETIVENNRFRQMYAKGKSFVSPSMVLYVMPRKGKEKRLGITVSKKLAGGVLRNRMRRRLKETYRVHQEFILDGYDYILVARGRALTCPYPKLLSDFKKVFSEAGVWKKEGELS